MRRPAVNQQVQRRFGSDNSIAEEESPSPVTDDDHSTSTTSLHYLRQPSSTSCSMRRPPGSSSSHSSNNQAATGTQATSEGGGGGGGLKTPTTRRHSSADQQLLTTTTGRSPSCSPTRQGLGGGSPPSSSSSNPLPCFDFQVGDCFLLGCPLALVLAFRKCVHSHSHFRLLFINKTFLATKHRWSGAGAGTSAMRPRCNDVYNLFHLMDPLAARLEPLISARFAHTQPVSVPRYQRYPLGDGKSASLQDFVNCNPQMFNSNNSTPTPTPSRSPLNVNQQQRRQSDPVSVVGGGGGGDSLANRWWGTKRLASIKKNQIIIYRLYRILILAKPK